MATLAQGIHQTAGIYTREIDLTYSAKSLGITTLGLVGETQIGPAFQPISISNWTEFKTYFGGTNTEKYPNGYPRYELPYVAKTYLSESNQLYVTRVLGLSGFNYDGIWSLYNDNSTTTGDTSIKDKTVLATFRSKSYYATGETCIPYVSNISIQTGGTDITGTSVDFTIIATYNPDYISNKSITSTGETYTVSLDSSKKNYILNSLGNTPNGSSNAKIFVEEMFETAIKNLNDSNKITGFFDGISIQMSVKNNKHDNYRSIYSQAKTPYFVSEIKGDKITPLFRFMTVSAGENANNMFKISIVNIDMDTLKFDVQVRSINDTDATPIIYETFANCTMNPSDGNNYIGAKIGTVDELYAVKSKFIIADINDDPSIYNSIPMGFGGYETKYISISGQTNNASDYFNSSKIIYNTNYYSSIKQGKQYYGLSNLTGVDSDFFKFNGSDSTVLSITDGFHMESGATNITGVTGIGADSIYFQTLSGTTYDETFDDKRLMKFTAYFYGGFDGWDIFRENRTIENNYNYNSFKKYPLQIGVDKQFSQFVGTELETKYNIPNITDNVGITSDFYAFWSAIRTFANPELIDINVFATPGIDTLNNSILVNETIDMLENERKDSIYIVNTPDKPLGTYNDTKASMSSADSVVADLTKTGIDSSFAATYYPWLKFYDKDQAQYIYLSPTKDVVKSLALTDNTAYSWFAPAGMTRGSVDCVKAKKNLILSEEDALANGRINAIKTFSADGIKIWGQKTLQSEDTQLNRIGVRRLMLYLRKTIRRGNLPLIFEPNDNTTKNKFLEIVNPILNSVKSGRGISEYRILVDDSVEAKANHQLNVIIYIKPIGALEFINIDFIITDEGFDFNSI